MPGRHALGEPGRTAAFDPVGGQIPLQAQSRIGEPLRTQRGGGPAHRMGHGRSQRRLPFGHMTGQLRQLLTDGIEQLVQQLQLPIAPA